MSENEATAEPRPAPAPERHLLRLERYPAQDAVLTIDGQPCRVVRLKVTPDVTEILYESEARIAEPAPDRQGDETVTPAPDLTALRSQLAEVRNALLQGGQDDASVRRRAIAILENYSAVKAAPARELAEAMAETRRVAETVRPVLDCFTKASDGWRGRISAVVLARAYAATGTVPDYLKHVEGQ